MNIPFIGGIAARLSYAGDYIWVIKPVAATMGGADAAAEAFCDAECICAVLMRRANLSASLRIQLSMLASLQAAWARTNFLSWATSSERAWHSLCRAL